MISLLPALISVAFIILIGLVADRTLKIEIQPLSQLTVYILAPALVASSLYHTSLSVKSTASLLLGFALISLILYVIVRGISYVFKLSSNTYKSLIATTLLPNNGNLGLPVIAFAWGDAGLERAIIYMIGSTILLFGIVPSLLKGNGFYSGINLTLKLPLIWAMLAGVSLRLFSIQLPFSFVEMIELLGKASIPIALVILGMQLSTTDFQVRKYELFATFLRLALAPLIAYPIGFMLGLTNLDLQVFIVQSAMPVAVNSVVLVTEFGGDASKVARTIVVTTISSFITLPMIMSIL